MTQLLRFGLNIDPSTANLGESLQRAQFADAGAFDVISIQDHPYNRQHLDTWTLLTVLGARTERVRLLTNVTNLPLRPPAMLAKMAATLDVVTGGRVEVGLGAGAYWQGITAYGGPKRTPGEAYGAFEDALNILRGMWDNAGSTFSYEGKFYQVNGARPGPAPAHRIPIWVGALGPRMLKLTGQMADGLLVSLSYVPPEHLPDVNARLDEGAQSAGRSPDAIERGYNLMGTITAKRGATDDLSQGLHGPVDAWVESIVRFHQDYRQTLFTFWPTGGDEMAQIELFANEVIPAVRAAVSDS